MRTTISRETATRLVLEMVVIVASVLLALVVNEWRQGRDERVLVERLEESIEREVRSNQEEVQRALDAHVVLLDELSRGERLLAEVSRDELEERGLWPVDDLESVTRMVREMARQSERREQAEELSVEATGENEYRARLGGAQVKIRVGSEGAAVYGAGNIRLAPAEIRDTAWSAIGATGGAVHLPFDLVEEMAAVHTQQRQYLETVSKIVDLLYEGNLRADHGAVRPQGFEPMIQDMIHAERDLLARYEAVLELL